MSLKKEQEETEKPRTQKNSTVCHHTVISITKI